jgi:hypothetical protein
MNRFPSLIALAILVLSTQAGRAAVTEVENQQEPTRHPYQAFATANCGLPGVCAVAFSPITTDRTLITHVSCGFSMSTTYGYVTYAFLNAGPVEPVTGIPFNNLQLFTFSSKEGVTNYGINTETYLFFESGDTPTVALGTSEAAAGRVVCTVSGYYE